MIESIFLSNYRIFQYLEMELNPRLNIIVGNNETGKSTLLEAVNLALTRRLHGRMVDGEVSPYLFNKAAVDDYLAGLRSGGNPPLPRILIELYLSDDCGLNTILLYVRRVMPDATEEELMEASDRLCRYAAFVIRLRERIERDHKGGKGDSFAEILARLKQKDATQPPSDPVQSSPHAPLPTP